MTFHHAEMLKTWMDTELEGVWKEAIVKRQLKSIAAFAFMAVATRVRL